MDSVADVHSYGLTTFNTSSIPRVTREVPASGPIKFDPEATDYDMSGDKILVIFNHQTYKKKWYCFKKLEPRDGTEKDVESLKSVFDKLNFRVITFHDLNYKDILAKATEIANQDHSKTSCLAVAILTHGKKGGLYARDKAYQLKKITHKFAYGHPGLVNKPKLFFIQACRGGKIDAGRLVKVDTPRGTIIEAASGSVPDSDIPMVKPVETKDEYLIVPSHVDFFYLYSNVDGNISWRNKYGSWLIQELCKAIAENHETKDLLQLATLTINKVAYQYSTIMSKKQDKKFNNKKQTPETKSTLTKSVFF